MRKKPGPTRLRRNYIHPNFRNAVFEHRLPMGVLALMAGYPQLAPLSNQLHREDGVPSTKLTTTRLRKLAQIVGYPPDRIFVEMMEIAS